MAVGDHLARYGLFYKMKKYFHHGICVKRDPLRIVEFNGEGKSQSKIRIVDIDTFREDKDIFRVNHKNRRTGVETAATALQIANRNTNEWGKYHVFNNNCEHFATYCVTGEKSSEQVLKTIEISLLQLYQGFLPF